MNATAARRGRPRSAHDRKAYPDGRIRVRTDDGWEWEHRLVMGRIVGRKLRRGERVTHLNGDPGDNRPENLTLDGDRCPNCNAPLGFLQRLARMNGASRGSRHRGAHLVTGQARLWRGAP